MQKSQNILYLVIFAIHFISIVAIVYNIFFIFVLILDLLYYIFRKGSLRLFIKMLIISLIVGIINLFIVGGKIYYSTSFFVLSEFGLVKCLKNFSLLFGIFVFTNNFFSEKVIAIDNNPKTLTSISFNYLNCFIDIIAKSSGYRNIIRKIIVLYRTGAVYSKKIEPKISTKYKIYNYVSVLLIFVVLLYQIIEKFT